ncbi:MAG: hypothetical protein M3R72_09565, partial [Bacteroidota bacterium]|nr:hypothetical protein [Bacteroidota bacterium]
AVVAAQAEVGNHKLRVTSFGFFYICFWLFSLAAHCSKLVAQLFFNYPLQHLIVISFSNALISSAIANCEMTMWLF